MKALDTMAEISEEDSFADGIQSVKGDIEQSDRGSSQPSPIQVAKNVEEEKNELIVAAPAKIEEDYVVPDAVTTIIKIPDWPQRMDPADYSAEQRRNLQICWQKMEDWLQLRDMPTGWNHYHSEKGVTIH